MTTTAQAMEQSTIDEAVKEADKLLAGNPEYQTANESRKKEIREETIRRLTVSKVQSLFDSMQMQVDKKIDEMVDA